MSDAEIQACYARLGASETATMEELNRLYLQKSYALIRSNASEEQREQLKQTHATLVALVEAKQALDHQAEPGPAVEIVAPKPVVVPARHEEGNGDLFGFGNPWITAIAPLVVGTVGVLMRLSPMGFLLEGFHVWMHELGHATVAWMTGHRALPLPIGWTNIATEKSLFVYFGLLFLFGVLAVAGWKERKPVAVVAAVVLAAVQAWMTWLLPENRVQMAISFSGVGGEFYLAAAMMALFFVELPEKFKWGVCRYVVFFIAAGSFTRTFLFWRAVKSGAETIPYGSMIGGEDDANGDMDTLRDDFHWREHEIISTYTKLGNLCLLALLVVYVLFVLNSLRVRRQAAEED